MSEINGNEVLPKLPDGWELRTLGDLGEYHNGRGFKKTEWRQAGRPIIRIQNLTDPSKPYNHFDGEADQRHTVRAGDLLVSWAATLDVFRWEGPEAVVNQHIFKVDSNVEIGFHFWALKRSLALLRASAHGTGIVHVTRGRFLGTPVAVPPREQRADFVAFIERTLAAVDDGLITLKTTRDRLDALVASTIEHEIWNSDYGEQPDDRLDGLEQERRQMFGRSLTDGTRRGRYKPAAEVRGDVPSCRGARVTSLDQVTEFVTDGDHNPPKRQPSGIPHLTAKHVRHFTLDFSDTTFIDQADFEKVAKRYRPQPSDVVVTCVGTIGRVATVPEAMFSPDRNLAAARPLPSIDPRYLMYVLASPSMQARMARASGSTAQPHLYLGDLRELPVPAPGLSAQRQVVRRIENTLAAAAAVNADLVLQELRARALTTTVLYQAFDGGFKLIPAHDHGG